MARSLQRIFHVNLSLKIICVIGQATAPLLTFEIIGAIGLLGAFANQLASLSLHRKKQDAR